MRVAYHSPMPPSTSGIADYSALLVPALGELVDLTVIDGPDVRVGASDLALYHIGNNPDAHGWIIEALRRKPGLVVLHEHVLHHLVAGMTIARGDREGYLRAMQRDAGVVGRLMAHGVIDGVVPPVWETRPVDFPLCGEVLDHATGLIVHSATVEAAARARGYAGSIHRIPHPAWPVPKLIRDPALDGATGPVFGAFGHLNFAKRAPQLVEAFALVLASRPEARLLLVGDAAEDLGVDWRLTEIESAHPGAVIRLPYVEEARLWSLIAGCDVCVCLRHPTMGETSGIAIRAMSVGRPLIVTDTGWFAEIPDEIAIRVAPDADEAEALAAAMRSLADDHTRRERMGAAAAAYAVSELALGRVAEGYRRAIVEAAGGQAVRDGALREIARAAAEVGLDPAGPEVGLIAERVREVRL